MIVRIEDIKDICNKILVAVDSNDFSLVTETLELKTSGQTLYLSVTNNEYYAQVKLGVDEEVNFHATVNATLFLKLISQLTTETVEFKVEGNVLIVKGNGTYKLPLIYDNDKLLEVPEIKVENVTTELNVDGSVLNSILTYNSKELQKNVVTKLIQKLYYVDENGAITFTSGACVNSFTLEKPIKILLGGKVVKLFKLFKDDTTKVKVSLGHTTISEDVMQTRVKFESDKISISAILPGDDNMVATFPVDAIRNRATNVYPHSVVLDKEELIRTIGRLLLFQSMSKTVTKAYSQFDFNKSSVVIYDNTKNNKEEIYYTKPIENEFSYTATIDLMDLKYTLDNCTESHITLKFGDGQAFVVSRGNIHNVIPEVVQV